MRYVNVRVDRMHRMRTWDCHAAHQHHRVMVAIIIIIIMWSMVKWIAQMPDDISIIVHWACWAWPAQKFMMTQWNRLVFYRPVNHHMKSAAAAASMIHWMTFSHRKFRWIRAAIPIPNWVIRPPSIRWPFDQRRRGHHGYHANQPMLVFQLMAFIPITQWYLSNSIESTISDIKCITSDARSQWGILQIIQCYWFTWYVFR